MQIDLTVYPLVRHVESSEIYLASATSEGNPKIRDEQIDIKALQLVNDGLEQWKPVLKASFPLSEDQLVEVYRAFRLTQPSGTGPYSLDALLRMIDEDARIWTIVVDKVRDQYDVDGCIVEISEVRFDGEVFHTVAAEHSDPVKVRDTVARLGLLGRENISYVKAAQRIKMGTLS
jgi:exopolyphosphatase/guanosine-5'-triphosphate,3'-diphosphate pyrophosphatase